MKISYNCLRHAAISGLLLTGIAYAYGSSEMTMPKARTSSSSSGIAVAPRPLGRSMAPSSAYLPELQGNVLYPPTSSSYLTMAKLPDFNTPELRFEPLSPTGLTANGGGALVDGIYWCGMIMSFEGFDYYSICSYDGETWDQLSYTETTPGLMATDVALDPTDGKVYGCFYGDDGSGAVFGTIDYVSQIRREIAPLEVAWSGCAVDPDGNLYALDMHGELWTVNKQTGVMSDVGSTGLHPVYLSSACFDPHSGRLFYSYSPADDSGWLYEIDPDTAEATPLYRFPGDEEVVGMYVAPAKADYNAPGAPLDAEVSFDGNSLSGTLSFTMPQTTYGGESLAGMIGYAAFASDSPLASGTASPGEAVAIPVSVPDNGLYEFKIVLSNDAGNGPAETIIRYVGNDTPTAPKVKASNSGGAITISWDPVVSGVHGGYMDSQSVTYKVVRSSDNSVVAENTNGLSVVDPMEQPEELMLLKYCVTASCNGMTSAPGVSNQIAVGPYLPPLSENFQSEDSFDSFVVIDANNDGNVWYHFYGTDNNGRARIRYNSSKQMDDWLITPAIRLEGGKVYILHFDAAKEGAAVNIEKIEVKYGRGTSVADMTLSALAPTDVTSNDLTTFTCQLTPTEDGIYHIGFHGCSPKDRFWLHLDNIELQAGAIPGAPDAVSNFEVTPGSYGRHQADIAFNVPATTFDGNPLTTIAKAEIRRDDAVIYTVDNPAPGSLIFYTDFEPHGGLNTYTALAYNDLGAGKPTSATVFIGTRKPQPCKSVSLRETENHGEVVVSWVAPDRDVEGTAINPGVLTYTIYSNCPDGTLQQEASGVSGLSHTLLALEGKDRDFVTYSVAAVSEGGEAEATASLPIPVGCPSELPFRESFTDDEPGNILCFVTEAGNGSWTRLRDSSISGVISADSDNAYAAFNGREYGDRASLMTGKIDLRNSVKPLLTARIFNMTGSEANSNPVEIYANDGNGYVSLVATTLDQTGNINEWNLLTADLSPFNGKEVWLKFSSQVENYTYTMLDAILLEETDPSGIFEASESHIRVEARDGELTVSGAAGLPVSICTLDGSVILSVGRASAIERVSVVQGLYIVCAGGETSKIFIR